MTAAVVLAAGLGKRMKSSLPKVLHRIHGSPMLQHVLNTLSRLKLQRVVIVTGKFDNQIRESIRYSDNISFAHQREALGTGDALMKASPLLRGFRGTVLIVNGDTPLITPGTIQKFQKLHRNKCNAISLLTFHAGDPGAYGRVIRDGKDTVLSIVENSDANETQKKIREVNSGIYAIETSALSLLKEITMNASKREYYLTDIIGIARGKGIKVGAYCVGSEDEMMGINTRQELDRARSLLKERIIGNWLSKGVSFMDPSSVYLSSEATIGKDTVIYPNVHIEGPTRIGKECTICPNVRIVNSIIEKAAIIKDSTLIEDSVISERASIGPFAHLRPGSRIGRDAKIGNFVEVKKSVIGRGTKASHLTYLGDAKVGSDVNIGAGTITCNYDGRQKHVTVIGNGAFIGSDSQLVAPVKIGKGAFVGAGATITADVPPGALALSRTQQKNISGWAMRKSTSMETRKPGHKTLARGKARKKD
jgi:bifunctional UDP-N-acetylglucosamine pyrophosphorylase/glucosamine-1-phosphate N-acetyltransferase